MKERPISFSAEILRAVVEGRETMTRRVIVPQPDNWAWDGQPYVEYYKPEYRQVYCPYGAPGDRLWVRESIRRRYGVFNNLSGATYCSTLLPVDGIGPAGGYMGRALVDWRWKRDVLPAICMPRWASRITLEVLDVRVEIDPWCWVVSFRVVEAR